MKDFEKSLKEVMSFIEGVNSEGYSEKAIVSKTEGRKYIKIFCGSHIYCFIEKSTGDIFRAASYKAPAKHARGNIFKPENWKEWLLVYSPKYLR